MLVFTTFLLLIPQHTSSHEFHNPGVTEKTESEYDAAARKWLDHVNKTLFPLELEATRLAWKWYTNITDHNKKLMTAAELKLLNSSSELAELTNKKFNLHQIVDPELRRLVDKVQRSRMGSTHEERKWMTEASNRLSTIHNKAKICPANLADSCDDEKKISLNPYLHKIFKNSRNATELQLLWKRWHDVAGKPGKKYFFDIIENSTTYEERIGYKSMTEKWLHGYEFDSPDFRKDMQQLFKEILPFYEDLHAYARHRLSQFYGKDSVSEQGPIPQHLLGSILAGYWSNIMDILKPFPDEHKTVKTVTDAMKDGNWTAHRMFKAAEAFYTSVGMPKLPESFWNESMLEKPHDGRSVVCQPIAWDMFSPGDARIQMCTQVNSLDFGTVHQELGQIYYYLAYKDQNFLFRSGANPGFHEAVGDTILISSSQNIYLKHLKLLPEEYTPSNKDVINKLMEKALRSIAFLPFGYFIDLWRWDIFDGKVKKDESNAHWWNLRTTFQGVKPPVPREKDDFDPTAMFHVSEFVPYIRYYVAQFLQFEFHNALCKKAGLADDLSTCSIFGNKIAGEKLWSTLKLGSSVPWTEALKDITGSEKISAAPMLRFYKVLRKWLRTENKKNGVCLGWGIDWPASFNLNGPRCQKTNVTYANQDFDLVRVLDL